MFPPRKIPRGLLYHQNEWFTSKQLLDTPVILIFLSEYRSLKLLHFQFLESLIEIGKIRL